MDIDELLDRVRHACDEGRITRAAFDNVRRWLTEPAYRESVPDIAALIEAEDWTTLDDSFYTVLEFGTGGRRGPRGVGPNRINARTIAESARGLADWVVETQGSGGSVVIAYDTRHASSELARVCAEVVAAAGLKALMFDGFRPTPQLSFMVRHSGASAGIVISASHNPPSDNGFKAYGPDGGQLVPPYDEQVMNAVKNTMGREIPRVPFDEGVAQGAIRLLGDEEDRAYYEAVLATSRSDKRDAVVVYTPLHGAGIRSVPAVLATAGFRELHLVDAQAYPDGDFPNVANRIPNPEEPQALENAARMAEKLRADVAIGTDPDADRLGCWALRNGSLRKMERLTGNQIGAILCQHVLESEKRSRTLRPDHLILTTAVTSPIIAKLAKHYGVGVISELLVGFKYVACVLRSLNDPRRVLFACEESHGYLGGAYTRDKDGAGAALLLSEAASEAKAAGHDLWATLGEVYAMVGYHCDVMYPYLSPGRSGMERIGKMLEGLRRQPPRTLGGLVVRRVIDRRDNTVREGDTVIQLPPIRDPATHETLDALLVARDNLLIYELGGHGIVSGARAAVRPSGTEPKCKFYASAWTEPGHRSQAQRGDVDRVAAAVRDDLIRYAEHMGSTS